MVSLDADDGDGKGWNSPRIVVRITLGVIVTIIVQFVVLVSWLVKMNDDIQALKVAHVEMDKRSEALDLGGSRAAGLLNQRVGNMEANLVRIEDRLNGLGARDTEIVRMLSDAGIISTKAQAQIDACAANLKRIEEQDMRILNLLDELRTGKRK